MSIKIYLAGGFFENEDDWRYDLVNGLNASPPMVPWRTFKKWGTLPNAIFKCLDFIGPYPVQVNSENIYLIREAIRDSDIVFAWVDNLAPDEICKVSSEASYASALGKLVGVGASSPDGESVCNTWFVHELNSFFPFRYLGESPKDSLLSCLSYLVDFLPLEKQLQLNKSHHAKQFQGKDFRRGGYVYVIRAETGQYKIGRSNNVPRRMKLFSVKLPFSFEIIHHFPCQDMYLAEDDLHVIFKSRRGNGEWFNLTDEDIALIKRISHWESISLFTGQDWGDSLPELQTDEIDAKYSRLYRNKEYPFNE